MVSFHLSFCFQTLFYLLNDLLPEALQWIPVLTALVHHQVYMYAAFGQRSVNRCRKVFQNGFYRKILSDVSELNL